MATREYTDTSWYFTKAPRGLTDSKSSTSSATALAKPCPASMVCWIACSFSRRRAAKITWAPSRASSYTGKLQKRLGPPFWGRWWLSLYKAWKKVHARKWGIIGWLMGANGPNMPESKLGRPFGTPAVSNVLDLLKRDTFRIFQAPNLFGIWGACTAYVSKYGQHLLAIQDRIYFNSST